MTTRLRLFGIVFLVASAAGCGDRAGSAPTPTNPRPDASEMFDKKEMPKGAKGKADPG